MFTLLLFQFSSADLASRLHFVFPVLLALLLLLVMGVVVFLWIKNKMRTLR